MSRVQDLQTLLDQSSKENEGLKQRNEKMRNLLADFEKVCVLWLPDEKQAEEHPNESQLLHGLRNRVLAVIA